MVGGRRRFTLFPPVQLENLYVAPLDFTPSGAPVSLVQFTQPDHARFPRYVEALRHAQQAELGPGDALYIPFGWWHHVESLTPFNVLVNYKRNGFKFSLTSTGVGRICHNSVYSSQSGTTPIWYEGSAMMRLVPPVPP